jgi:hypothetical protein
MRQRLLLGIVFSIGIFAGFANAQHTRVIFGSEHGIWRGADGGYTLLPSNTVGTIDARAGQTLKLRFARASNQGRITAVAVDPTDPAVIYQVPCEGDAIVVRENGTREPSVTDLIIDPFDRRVATSPDWRGTCRMAVVKLIDGSVRGVRIRFH